MLDANLDYSFGQGQGNFLTNVPEAVAQYVLTRLNLWQGNWFYDTSIGVPWATEVLGERTQQTRDVVVQAAITQTPGVLDLADYVSVVAPVERRFAAAATIDTIYGQVQLGVPALPGTVPPLPPAPGAGQLLALGIQGGPPPETQTAMNRAPMDRPGPQNVTTFVIRSMDAGSVA